MLKYILLLCLQLFFLTCPSLLSFQLFSSSNDRHLGCVHVHHHHQPPFVITCPHSQLWQPPFVTLLDANPWSSWTLNPWIVSLNYRFMWWICICECYVALWICIHECLHWIIEIYNLYLYLIIKICSKLLLVFFLFFYFLVGLIDPSCKPAIWEPENFWVELRSNPE